MPCHLKGSPFEVPEGLLGTFLARYEPFLARFSPSGLLAPWLGMPFWGSRVLYLVWNVQRVSRHCGSECSLLSPALEFSWLSSSSKGFLLRRSLSTRQCCLGHCGTAEVRLTHT